MRFGWVKLGFWLPKKGQMQVVGSSSLFINHLLLHCSRTRALWDLLFALFGVSWVMPFSVRDTLLSWNGYFLGKNRKKI